MVLNKTEALPVHEANSHVQMIVARGTLSISLAEQDTHVYEAGSILNIPFGTKMFVRNEHEPVLELFVVKAPTSEGIYRQVSRITSAKNQNGAGRNRFRVFRRAPSYLH